MVDPPEAHTAVFITFTYPAEFPTDPPTIKAHRNQFLQSLRRIIPSHHYIWRLEWQERGAPHYHMVLWIRQFADDPSVRDQMIAIAGSWHEITGSGSKAHEAYGVQWEEMNSYRQTSKYISKYVGKHEDTEDHGYNGRRWAASTGLPRPTLYDDDIPIAVYTQMIRSFRRWLRKSKRSRRWVREALDGHHTVSIYADNDMVFRLLEHFLDEYERVNGNRGERRVAWHPAEEELRRIPVPPEPDMQLILF